MIEEVKLYLHDPPKPPMPLKGVHHEKEVMVMPHPKVAAEWWYRVGTLMISDQPRAWNEPLRWCVKFGPHNIVAGFTTTDQVLFVRDRNRHLVLELCRKADELRDVTKRLSGEIDALMMMLKGNRK